jgi:poly-gamma-glutamate capsule biosynthesis protein CapA/YwtB (metallophosphatase superfamily)
MACVITALLFTLVATPPQVHLVAVGDVMLGRGVAVHAARHGNPLQHLTPLLTKADVAFANLECTLSNRGRRKEGGFALRAAPVSSVFLSDAGLDVVSLANNHTTDFGPHALLDTADAVAAAGVLGVGLTGPDAPRFSVVMVRGVRVAFVAFNDIEPSATRRNRTGVAALNLQDATRAVEHARHNADVVVVSLHWGYQYQHAPTRHMRRVAHALSDAGAHLILGHHPHVIQGLERRGRTVIAYSLGNAVFDQRDPKTHRGLALDVVLNRDGVVDVTLLPLDTRTPSPTLLTGRAARRALKDVKVWSRPLGNHVLLDERGARVVVPPPPPVLVASQS